MSDAPPQRFTLRVPVRTLGEKPIADLEPPLSFKVGELVVTVKATPPVLVTVVEGFASEEAATAFIPQVVSALWGLVLQWNIAFRANFSPQAVSYATDPVAAGKNLGVDAPVDGTVGLEDTVIFPTGKRLRYWGVGTARATVHTPAGLALPLFKQMLERKDCQRLVEDHGLRLAMELFNAAFHEASAQARFIAAITILETLAPEMEKHPAAQTLVGAWKDQLDAILKASEDADLRHALESLNRELDFRKETSIRQRVRWLIRAEFADVPEAERQELERQAVYAYDQRSTLVHTGQLPNDVLHECRAQSSAIVRRILARRLGIDLQQ